MTNSNNAPRTLWHRVEMARGTIRHRLYVNGLETPYFVDDAKRAGKGHWQGRSPIALQASGSGSKVRRRDGTTYRIALFLQGFTAVGVAKARAEQMALQNT